MRGSNKPKIVMSNEFFHWNIIFVWAWILPDPSRWLWITNKKRVAFRMVAVAVHLDCYAWAWIDKQVGLKAVQGNVYEKYSGQCVWELPIFAGCHSRKNFAGLLFWFGRRCRTLFWYQRTKMETDTRFTGLTSASDANRFRWLSKTKGWSSLIDV